MKLDATMIAALGFAAALCAADAPAVTIDTVLVGDAGNAPDENYNDLGQYGAVDHAYRIGKYEVTNSQYAEFLNAKAKSDPFNLYNTNMGSEIHGGISQSGPSGDFNYEVRTNMGNKPVNYVSFYDAIRFANWLNNGQGGGDTETGAYTLANGTGVVRNAGSTWFLPTGDEWYKAAYYDPRLESQGGPAGDDHYWYYPTMSDSLPASATANSVGDVSNPGLNVANYNHGAVWNGYDAGNVTTVGSAGPLSNSYYGTADQGGNLWEWSDQFASDDTSPTRGHKGGAWTGGPSGQTLTAHFSGHGHGGATMEIWTTGFRVATVPEPTSIALLALGLPLLLWRKLGGAALAPLTRRRRRRAARSIIRSLLTVLSISCCVAKWSSAITINTVPVGNAGNAGDPQVLPDLTTGYGAVSYNYRIATTEVTVGQYTAFLNAVAVSDTYELYDMQMTNHVIAGIARDGVLDNYTYSVIGSANKPVTFVSWGDAVRFSNWLHNGQPLGAQDSTTTESGAYTLNGAVTSAELSAVSRNAGATWFIPSENEWYKAAYHQPSAQGGDSDDYWAYPTRSNNDPYSDQPPGIDAPLASNTANYFANDWLDNGYNDGYAVTGSFEIDFPQNYLTDAGAYSAATSPYGTFDQGGNVWEWTEKSRFPDSGVGIMQVRGGAWDQDVDTMHSAANSYAYGAGLSSDIIGFRVATVPEPSSFVLFSAGLGGALSLALVRRTAAGKLEKCS